VRSVAGADNVAVRGRRDNATAVGAGDSGAGDTARGGCTEWDGSLAASRTPTGYPPSHRVGNPGYNHTKSAFADCAPVIAAVAR